MFFVHFAPEFHRLFLRMGVRFFQLLLQVVFFDITDFRQQIGLAETTSS